MDGCLSFKRSTGQLFTLGVDCCRSCGLLVRHPYPVGFGYFETLAVYSLVCARSHGWPSLALCLLWAVCTTRFYRAKSSSVTWRANMRKSRKRVTLSKSSRSEPTTFSLGSTVLQLLQVRGGATSIPRPPGSFEPKALPNAQKQYPNSFQNHSKGLEAYSLNLRRTPVAPELFATQRQLLQFSL